jgi:hypothetical protein
MERFTQEFDLNTYQENIFRSAKISPDELRLARSNADSDESFSQSDSMRALSRAMDNNPVPSDGLQHAIDDCDVQFGAKTSSDNTSENTLYIGFHMEGGAIFDG